MTDCEKSEHPECETTGGFLKKIHYSKDRQAWWDDLPEDDKAEIKSLPNFDPAIFGEIMGVKVE
jgi:hypothetical protein